MTNLNEKSTSVSIRNKLLILARQTQRPFNELLQYYGMERYLYRLGQSEHSSRFVLKGALLFHVWDIQDFRATRDIDMLGFMENTAEHIKKIVCHICELNVDCQDGVTFDSNTVIAKVMQAQREYEGVRVTFKAALEGEKNMIPMQIDFGFGDLVTPSPKHINYPTMLDLPAPNLCGYPVETVIAEKIHTTFEKGAANSRVKDYHDIWMLLRWGKFEHSVLEKALEKTFKQRKTTLDYKRLIHTILLYSCSNVSQRFWEQYRRKGGYESTPVNLAQICFDLIAGLGSCLVQFRNSQPTLGMVIYHKDYQELLHNDFVLDYFCMRLNNDADSNDASRNGHRILQLVIKHDQIKSEIKFELVKLLIEFGANVDRADQSLTTPFQAAVIIGDKKIADFLVSKGARRIVPPGGGYAKYYNMYRNLPTS